MNLEDYIKHAQEVKTKIDWYDVNNKRYVTLKRDFQIKLVTKAIKNAGSQNKLIRFLRKSESQIRNYKKGKFNLTVGTLKRLAEIAAISYEEIRENILCLGGIINPKLPFCMNTIDGIKIRAKILSSFKKQIGTLRGKYGVPKAYKNAYGTYFPPVFGDILELSGVSRGWKSIKNPFIPKDILLDDISNQVTYLREVFTDEGTIEFSNKYRVVSLNRNIIVGDVNKSNNYIKSLPTEKIVALKKLSKKFQNKLKDNPSKLILGEALLLKKLGIDCKLKPKWIRINKNGTISLNWKLSISRKRNLILFHKLIGFSIKTKQEKLKRIIESYTDKTEYGYGHKRALLAAIILTKQNQFFTSKQLANKLSISIRSASRYIKEMIKNKDITKLEGYRYATITY